MYDLVWREREDSFYEAAKVQGDDIIPEIVKHKPRLWPWLEWYYEAFAYVDAGRPHYQGAVGAIPLTEYAAYLNLIGLGEIDAKMQFVRMMRALDSVYVQHVNEQIQRKLEQQRREMEDKSGRSSERS